MRAEARRRPSPEQINQAKEIARLWGRKLDEEDYWGELRKWMEGEGSGCSERLEGVRTRIGTEMEGVDDRLIAGRIVEQMRLINDGTVSEEDRFTKEMEILGLREVLEERVKGRAIDWEALVEEELELVEAERRGDTRAVDDVRWQELAAFRRSGGRKGKGIYEKAYYLYIIGSGWGRYGELVDVEIERGKAWLERYRRAGWTDEEIERQREVLFKVKARWLSVRDEWIVKGGVHRLRRFPTWEETVAYLRQEEAVAAVRASLVRSQPDGDPSVIGNVVVGPPNPEMVAFWKSQGVDRGGQQVQIGERGPESIYDFLRRDDVSVDELGRVSGAGVEGEVYVKNYHPNSEVRDLLREYGIDADPYLTGSLGGGWDR